MRYFTLVKTETESTRSKPFPLSLFFRFFFFAEVREVMDFVGVLKVLKSTADTCQESSAALGTVFSFKPHAFIRKIVTK